MLFRKIDVRSPESVSTGLDFFSYPCTSVSFSKSQYKEILPMNPANQSPLHFRISGTSGFPDFNHMYLKTEIQVKKWTAGAADWENIVLPVAAGPGGIPAAVAGDDISMIQAPGQSFIRNLKIDIGGREVYTANNLQCWKSHFDTELAYSADAKITHLALMGYYPETTQNDAGSLAFAGRRHAIGSGKQAEYIAKINADPLNIDKYFVNNTDVDIHIIPNDANFMILAPGLPANTRLKYEIKSCKLYVMVHDLVDGLALSMNNQLEKDPVKYAIRRSELKTIYLPADQTVLETVLFSEQIPRRIYIGMLARADFDGNPTSSPFNFQPFDIENIRIDWNGLSNPSVPYELDFPNDHYGRAYYDMQMACGNVFTPMSNGITMQMFKDGWTIFVFNLTSNLEDEKCFELIRQGTTSLHAKFRTQIPAGGVTMLVYAEFDSLMMIDKNRTVTTDLTV